MATINLPDITPFQTEDPNILKLVDQLKRLKEAIKTELQKLEDNKADA
jgi:hypothetical protein